MHLGTTMQQQQSMDISRSESLFRPGFYPIALELFINHFSFSFSVQQTVLWGRSENQSAL